MLEREQRSRASSLQSRVEGDERVVKIALVHHVVTFSIKNQEVAATCAKKAHVMKCRDSIIASFFSSSCSHFGIGKWPCHEINGTRIAILVNSCEPFLCIGQQ
jgi:hypothetical protein